MPSVKNKSFLGCLPSIDKLNFDAVNSIEALKSVENLRREKCIEVCDSLMHAIAIFTVKNNKQSKADCVCLETLWRNIAKIREKNNPKECVNSAYITPWAFSKCSHATFLDPKQTSIPQVGLISVPGSGNTWTRSVVQSAIGILSGSKYHGEGAFSQKLHGEMEPWTSNRTTLIKNHEEGDNAGKFSALMDRRVVVIRDPLKCSIAEFNRRAKGKVGSFSSVEAFMKGAKNIAGFNKLFRGSLEHFLRLTTRYTKAQTPVLFISYEDMAGNLLPNLLRITKFMNMGSENKQILERSVCTILSDNGSKQSFKRTYKVDLTDAARSLIDKKYAIETVRRIENLFQISGMHELRTDDYISMING
ncbi:sialate:O-sulfotransferase 1-like isoform X2 [Convolutriloba macropyga]